MNKTLLKYFNYNISHGSLIIEENGEKFLIESNPGLQSDFPHRTVSVYQTLNGPWNVIKIPLMEHIMTYGTFIYQVLRPETPIPLTLYYPEPSTSTLYYCTMLVGDMLHHHGVIPKSTRLARYRTTELIQLLKEAGYNTFYLMKC